MKLQVRIKKKLQSELDEFCKRNDMKVSEVLREALKAYLKKKYV